MVAPLIAAALAPAAKALFEQGMDLLGNAVAAKGKEYVEDKLGVKLPDSSISPEVAVKLKELEIQHEEWLLDVGTRQKEQELRESELAYADTSDARKSFTAIQETANASWLAKNVAPILALFVVVGGGILLATTSEADVRTAVVGLITLVLGFFFGTSSSSHRKDGTIESLVQKRLEEASK